MPGPRQRLEVLEGKGRKHLTKAEKARRAAGEARPEVPRQIRAPGYLPDGDREAFTELGKKLRDCGLFTVLDGDALARYLLARRSWLEATMDVLEVQRGELAQRFNCVPSQINYVMSTRFSPERGYIVESRRGGNGYIRITRVQVDRETLLMHVINSLGERVDLPSARAILGNLAEAGALPEGLARTLLGDGLATTLLVALLGGGLVCGALSILFFMVTVAMAGIVTPAVFKGICKLFNKLCKN